MYSQCYSLRPLQSPHLLQRHVQAAFLSPPRRTRVWTQYLILCSPAFFLPQGLACWSRAASPSLHPGPLPSSHPEWRHGGSSQRQPERQKIPAHRAPSLPSATPLRHRNENLCSPVSSTLQSSQEDQFPHFGLIFYIRNTSWFFSALRTQRGLAGAVRG